MLGRILCGPCPRRTLDATASNERPRVTVTYQVILSTLDTKVCSEETTGPARRDFYIGLDGRGHHRGVALRQEGQAKGYILAGVLRVGMVPR